MVGTAVVRVRRVACGCEATVIANHLVSKDGDDPLFGRFQPARESTRMQRLEPTGVIHDFVQTILAIDPAANVVLVGDMNAFQFSGAPAELTCSNTSNPILTNRFDTIAESERYSCVFEAAAPFRAGAGGPGADSQTRQARDRDDRGTGAARGVDYRTSASATARA